MKKYVSAFAVFTLSCALFASGANAAEAAAEKDETVYARLSASGALESAYVVNHFESGGGGSFTDYGDYGKAVNMTDLNPVTLSSGAGGSVRFQTDSPNFYYQGYLTGPELPWVYKLTYRLDGAEVTPEQLAGASGKLEFILGITKNGAANPVFFDRYMQQITVTLDTSKARNIEASGATSANAGKNRVLAFTVLPGAETEINISADVTNFEMPGVDISAMPFSMDFDMPDTGGMADDFSLLTDALNELDGGVGELSDGAKEMQTGAEQLESGSATFDEGMRLISGNASGLTGASEQINNALSQMARALGGTDLTAQMPDMSQMARLPAGLTQLAGGLNQAAEGMTDLNAGYAQAFAALDSAINGIPEGTLGEDEITALYAATDPGGYPSLTQLVESYTAALTVKGTYAQTREAFAAVSPALETLAASLGTMEQSVSETAGQIGEALTALSATSDSGGAAAGLQELTGGIAELASNYSEFHSGLVSYTAGVSELADGYTELNGGIAELSGGIGDMAKGIDELKGGTSRMAEEAADMPDMVQSEIDELTAEYSGLLGGDFEPVSFASEKNTNVAFVQFVFKTAAVEKAEAETTAPAEEEPLSFWDRLTNLFK